MVYKYTLEILTVIAIGAFCALFLYTSATMNGAEFAGSDNVGSGLVAELSGIPLENFQPLIPQWEPPSGEIEACPVCPSGRSGWDSGRGRIWLLDGTEEESIIGTKRERYLHV